MFAQVDCHQYGVFDAADYSVYVCSSGYHWNNGHQNDPNCRAGYYLVPQTDNPGNGPCACKDGRIATAYPIEAATGNMSETATDFVSGGGRLRWERYYNSNPLNPGVGGTGWRNAYEARHIDIIENGLKSSLSFSDVAIGTSLTYNSAADACSKGVVDLAAGDQKYAGLTAVYSGNGQCQLSNGTSLSVFHTSATLAYALPLTDASAGLTVFRPDGSIYQYSCVNGQCTPLGRGELSLQATSNGYTLTTEDGDIETYDINGKLQSILAKDGYTQTIAYNADGTVLSVTDSHGRQMNLGYNVNGQVSSLSLPDQKQIAYGYDAKGRLTSVKYADNGSIGYQYTNAAFPRALTAWIDEAGTTYATWMYDSTTGVANGSALSGNVDTSALSYGNLATVVTDNLGTSRTYNFQDIAGGLRLVSVVGPVCPTCIGRTMSYDANGYLKSAIDWNGNETDYTYDATGLLTQHVEGVGTTDQRTTQIDWNTALRAPTERRLLNATNAPVAKTDWVYNTRGQPLVRCEIDPVQASGYTCAATGSVPTGVRRWTYAYCDTVNTTNCSNVGLLLTIDGPRDDVADITTYSYYMADGPTYRHGDLASVTDALGHVTRYLTYDGAGRLTSAQDTNGVFTDLTYTPRGWLATRTRRLTPDNSPASSDATTTLAYTPYGAIASVTDPDGVVMGYTYDAAHRLTDVTDALGNRIHYTLDAAGNKVKEETLDASNARSRLLSRSYNTLGQLTAITDGLNHAVLNAGLSDSYDANGNLMHTADGLGIERKQSYDALNRLVSTLDNYNGVDAATRNTQSVYTYDTQDRVVGVSDPSGFSTTYDVDSLGNTQALHSPDSGTTSYGYDAAGNRIQGTDARGTVQALAYDALNRVATVTYADATQNVTYHYDEANGVTGCGSSFPVGRLTRIVEDGVSTVYCYDARGNVTRKQQVVGTSTDTTAYAYTLGDRVSGITYPSGSQVSYVRDTDGRVQGVSLIPVGGSASTVASAVTYLPFGPMSGYSLGNGQAVVRTYDANYQFTDVTSTALNLHVARDAMGNVAALGDAPGASPAIETYSYDPLHRLTEIAGADSEAYTYDATGDRLSKTGGISATGAYTYQTGSHRLASVGSIARALDANGNTTGNVVAGEAFGFGYNARNRMTVVQRGGQTVGTYTYNGLGQRVAKVATLPQVTAARYGYDQAGHLIGEYGTSNRDYVWIGDLPVAVVDVSGATTVVGYVHADGLGTPRAVADATGSVVWQWGYAGNAFGEKVPTSAGYALNLRFPGQYFDVETGLNYNVNRYYESTTGRYGQSDPTGLWGGINTYASLNNSPLEYVDPKGLDAILMVNPISANLSGGIYGGHAAVAMGNDDTGWNFYSEGGLDGNGNQIITTQKFASLEDLESALGGAYTSQQGEHTQPLQDILMTTWARDHLKDPYSTTSNNCGDFVMNALRAGGLHPTANRIGPTIPNNMSIGDGPNDPNRFSPLEPTSPLPHPYRPVQTPTDSSPYTLGNPHTY